MKKKISAGLILAMVLVLVAAVALAVASITETGRLMAQTEQESGDYINWPTKKKIQVVTELMDEGYLTESAELTQLHEGTLTDADAARVADAAIEIITGEPAKNATFLSIMNAVWGPFEQWTQPQQAWYSQVMTDVGAVTEGKTYYVMPTDPMTAEAAVDIAKREIARGFNMEDELIDQYRVFDVSFQIPEFAKPGDSKAYWSVSIDTWGTELVGQEGLPFNAFSVFVDPDTGLLLEPIEDLIAAQETAQQMKQDSIRQTIQNFVTAVGETDVEDFGYWSLEKKARWSREMAPLVNAFVQEHGSDADYALSPAVKFISTYTYALPDEQAMSEAQALQLAGEALQAAYGLTNLQRDLLIDNDGGQYISAYYDVTDPARPLWKFLLRMPVVSDDGISETLAARVKAAYGNLVYGDYNLLYKAELDARTGEVIRTWTRKYREMRPELYCQEF